MLLEVSYPTPLESISIYQLKVEADIRLEAISRNRHFSYVLMKLNSTDISGVYSDTQFQCFQCLKYSLFGSDISTRQQVVV